MSSIHRCCCDAGDCCTVCDENCRVNDIGDGTGAVRIRVFVDLAFSEDRSCASSCGSGTGGYDYTLAHTFDVTIPVEVAEAGPCRDFAMDEIHEFVATGGVEGDCGCDGGSTPHDWTEPFSEDYFAWARAALNTNGTFGLDFRVLWVDDPGFEQLPGLMNLVFVGARDPGEGCQPFSVTQCFLQWQGALGLNSEPTVSELVITGLDSACHGDITFTIDASAARTAPGPGSSEPGVVTATATLSGTIRVLVEGIEPCDAETPMPAIPDECELLPDDEPTECCEVAGDPCKPTDTDPLPEITIERLYARINYTLDMEGTCDDGNIATPPVTVDHGWTWLGNLNLLGVTLLPEFIEDGCPVYTAHYEVTADISGTIFQGCTAGGQSTSTPATGTRTMTVDLEYRPGRRNLVYVVKLLENDLPPPFDSPLFVVRVELNPADSPVTDGSYAQLKVVGFPSTYDLDMPTEWDIDSYDAVCHSGVEFSGTANPPAWDDPKGNRGDAAVLRDVTVSFEGEVDLSGLEACA